MKSYFSVPVKLLMKAKDLDHIELLTALHLYLWGEVIHSRHLSMTTSGLKNYTGKGKTTEVMEALARNRIIRIKRRYKYYKRTGETQWYICLSMLPLKAYQNYHRKK